MKPVNFFGPQYLVLPETGQRRGTVQRQVEHICTFVLALRLFDKGRQAFGRCTFDGQIVRIAFGADVTTDQMGLPSRHNSARFAMTVSVTEQSSGRHGCCASAGPPSGRRIPRPARTGPTSPSPGCRPPTSRLPAFPLRGLDRQARRLHKVLRRARARDIADPESHYRNSFCDSTAERPMPHSLFTGRVGARNLAFGAGI